MMTKLGAKSCHLIATSFAGVDARAAISMLGGSDHIQSLTTVSSPHHGMRLIDRLGEDPEHVWFENLERVFEILGTSITTA